MLLPLVLHSVSPTICMSITAYMQDNHAHPVAPNLKEEKKTISDTVLSGEISILTACSKICMSCYRFFNETTKQLAQAKSGDQISHETQRCQGFIRTRSKICLDQEWDLLGPGVRHAINLQNIVTIFPTSLLVDSNFNLPFLFPHLHMKIVIVYLNLVTSKLLGEISSPNTVLGTIAPASLERLKTGPASTSMSRMLSIPLFLRSILFTISMLVLLVEASPKPHPSYFTPLKPHQSHALA